MAQYLQLYKFDELFETKDLNFQLYEYEKGEFISCAKDSMHFLQFIVSGTFHIYAIRPDGSHYPICVSDAFTILGDMEFCRETHLRCSRRQLLRILKTLCERNIIKKIGKGEYQLL